MFAEKPSSLINSSHWSEDEVRWYDAANAMLLTKPTSSEVKACIIGVRLSAAKRPEVAALLRRLETELPFAKQRSYSL